MVKPGRSYVLSNVFEGLLPGSRDSSRVLSTVESHEGERQV